MVIFKDGTVILHIFILMAQYTQWLNGRYLTDRIVINQTRSDFYVVQLLKTKKILNSIKMNF
jgi:hypothetical protein